jgi:hypothetical protein
MSYSVEANQNRRVSSWHLRQTLPKLFFALRALSIKQTTADLMKMHDDFFKCA